jgi:hypothetical protein
MFLGCTGLINLDGLATWNLSAVAGNDGTQAGPGQGYYQMFKWCSSLTDISALSSWTWNVHSTAYMFAGCVGLTTSDLAALSGWIMASCTNVGGMFYGCTGLTTLAPLADWDSGSCTVFHAMFWGCTSLLDISALANWDMSSIANPEIDGDTMFQDTAFRCSISASASGAFMCLSGAQAPCPLGYGSSTNNGMVCSPTCDPCEPNAANVASANMNPIAPDACDGTAPGETCAAATCVTGYGGGSVTCCGDSTPGCDLGCLEISPCIATIDCVESTADTSTCTVCGQELYMLTTAASGGGTPCTGSSALCTNGDNSIVCGMCSGNTDGVGDYTCTAGTLKPDSGSIAGNDDATCCDAPADCAGTWSACTADCEAAADRIWTEETASVGTGTACPDAANCAPGDDACPAATPPPADTSAAGMATITLTAVAVAAAFAPY